MLRLFTLLCLFAFSTQNVVNANSNNSPLPILSGVGGDFTGIGSDGEPFTFSDYYNDNVVMLFFGYTNCADVCPFTLGYLKQVYEKLTPAEQDDVQVLLVTIDPEYDTPEHLDEFVKFFNDDFFGVTGSKQQIDDIVALFQANYYKLSDNKVQTKNIRRINEKEVEDKETDSGDLYSHTVNVYLIDNKGQTRSLDYTGTDHPILLQKIRSLIAEKNTNKAETTESSATQADDSKARETTATTAPAQLRTGNELISVRDHWVPLAPPNTRVMAGFGKIVNNSGEAIYFTGAESASFGSVELHATEVVDGAAKMVKQGDTLIENEDFLAMQPGSYHLMLMQPSKAFKQGEIVTMTLNFSTADGTKIWREVIDFPIK